MTQGLIPSFRISQSDYDKMEKELPSCKLSREDTDIIAAQKLGVQLVLQYIRTHFLVR